MTTRSPARTIMSTWRARWRRLLLWLDSLPNERAPRAPIVWVSVKFETGLNHLIPLDPDWTHVRSAHCAGCKRGFLFEVTQRAAVGLGDGDKL